MSRFELNRIVSRDDKGLSEAKGLLSVLYRCVLYDLNIDAATLEQYLDRWVHDPRGPVKQTTKKITQARGNYIKKMIEPDLMTWKSFMDLLMMLYPKYIKVEVTLGWPGLDAEGQQNKTCHSIAFQPNTVGDDDTPPIFMGSADMIHNYKSEVEADDEDDEDIYGDSQYDQMDLFDESLDDDD